MNNINAEDYWKEIGFAKYVSFMWAQVQYTYPLLYTINMQSISENVSHSEI